MEQLKEIATSKNYTILNIDTISIKSSSILNIQCNNCKKIKHPSVIDFKRKNNNCRCNMSRNTTPLYTIINKCEGIYSKKYEIDKNIYFHLIKGLTINVSPFSLSFFFLLWTLGSDPISKATTSDDDVNA